MSVHHCIGSPCAICVSQMSVATDRTGVLWNGPICSTCGARYLGSHTCSREDITRRITELLALLSTLPATTPTPVDQTRNCPCRPENGGSGICGCVLGGPQITCSVTS